MTGVILEAKEPNIMLTNTQRESETTPNQVLTMLPSHPPAYCHGPPHTTSEYDSRGFPLGTFTQEEYKPSGSWDCQHHPAICWQNNPVLIELEGYYPRSMGNRDSDEGILHSSLSSPRAASSPTHSSPVTQRPSRFGGRDSITPTKESNPETSHNDKGLLLQCVHGPKKRWGSETHHNKPQVFEQICNIRILQDGGSSDR